MAKKKTDEKHPFLAQPRTAPHLDSPEFDQLSREWIEELIRRAKAKGPAPRATGAPVLPPVTIRARREAPSVFDYYLTNVYDLRTDPLGLMAGLKEVSRDALEVAIREAGFSGWVAPAGPGMKGPISSIFNFPEGVAVAVRRVEDKDEVVH